MYEVYSQQRPGHPRWTLAANAFVLLCAVGLAAAVSSYKSRALIVPLAKAQVYPHGQLRCALPAQWEVLDPRTLPAGVVVSAKEPDTAKRPRQLFIFRSPPHLLGLPLREGVVVLRQQMVALNLMDPSLEGELEAARIGVLPGVQMLTLKHVRVSAVAYTARYALGRIAIGPDGEFVGIVLAAPGLIDARDQVLMDEIADHLELVGVDAEKDAAGAMKAAGIRVDLPGEACLFAENVAGAARLRVSGGLGSNCWFLTASRVPLMPGRTPEALVRDFYLSTLEVPDLSEAITTGRVNDRATAQLHFAAIPGLPESILVLCAQTDSQTGLLLMARHEFKAKDEVLGLARRLAATAAVAGYSERLDLSAARGRSRAWIEGLGTRGLASLWGDRRRRRQTFAIRSPGLELGEESQHVTSALESDQRWWGLHVEFEIERAALRSVEDWHIREDARAYTYVAEQVHDGKRRKYTESWSGGDRIKRTLSGSVPGRSSRTTSVDEVFTTEPLLIAAAGSISTPGGPDGMLFSTTQLFTPDLCYWTVLPAGSRPLPHAPQRSAPAVLVQRDFDPTPILPYFDADQRLEAIQSAGGRYQVRMEPHGADSTLE